MNPKQISKLIESGEIVIIDVREKDEWNAGHIQGALHIPLGELEREVDVVKTIPKNLPIYTYCQSGGRAGWAENKLHELGFSNARNMGGVVEWQKNGGELVK